MEMYKATLSNHKDGDNYEEYNMLLICLRDEFGIETAQVIFSYANNGWCWDVVRKDVLVDSMLGLDADAKDKWTNDFLADCVKEYARDLIEDEECMNSYVESFLVM